MSDGLPSETQQSLRDLQRDDRERSDRMQLDARLAVGLAQPELLSPDERTLLEGIRLNEPDRFRELQRAAGSSCEGPLPARRHCSRLLPLAHAVAGFLIVGFFLWWFGTDRPGVYLMAAFPFLYGFWFLKSALFDSQEALDQQLCDED
jgi:hypothetical protein